MFSDLAEAARLRARILAPSDTEQADIRYADLAPADARRLNAEYAAAVDSGDTAKQQAMVDAVLAPGALPSVTDARRVAAAVAGCSICTTMSGISALSNKGSVPMSW
jgi:hypothetical protein